MSAMAEASVTEPPFSTPTQEPRCRQLQRKLVVSYACLRSATGCLDDADVGGGNGGAGLHGRNELRRARAVPVRVVVQASSAGVVDHAVVRIVRQAGARSPEARIARDEVAVRPKGTHRRIVERE